MKVSDLTLIASSPEAYARLKAFEAPALLALIRLMGQEEPTVRDYCLKVLAYGVAELPWLPTMTAQEAEILLREERGREVFVRDVVQKLWSCPQLARVRDVCMRVRKGRSTSPKAADAALYYLTCLSWLWMLDHDLFMRTAAELVFEEVVIGADGAA